VITTPHTLTQLLTDAGWERLARLLSDPKFCSEIVVGETLAEDQMQAPPPRTPRRRRAPH
jgi:hypothetical protein